MKVAEGWTVVAAAVTWAVIAGVYAVTGSMFWAASVIVVAGAGLGLGAKILNSIEGQRK